MNFNALNGLETQEFLLSKIREALEGSGEFRPNLTFPWFKFELSLKILHLAGLREEPQPAGEVKVEGKGEAGIPDSEAFLESLEFQLEGAVDVPDEARVGSGQAVHVEEVSDAGIKVDAPRKLKKPASAPWLQGGGA